MSQRAIIPKFANIVPALVGSLINQHKKHWGSWPRQETEIQGLPTTLQDWPRGSSPVNDNYCLNVLKAGLLPGSKQTVNPYQLPQSPSVFRRTMNIQTQNSISADLKISVPVQK